MINRKFLIAIFTWFICLPFAVGQYFEFTGNSNNGFQQGCPETYDVYYNTEGVGGISVGEILVNLDESRLIYSTANGITGQNALFSLNTSENGVFTSWTSISYPDWRSLYNEVKVSLKNEGGVINGYHKYGSFLFTGRYNINDYNVNFVFIYDGNSEATTLARGGSNMINANHQNSRLTGTIHVEQAPCMPDNIAPIIRIYGYSSSAKNVNSGLDIKLTDAEGAGSVPYVFNSNGVWTGNPGGINNQYGVDISDVTITVTGGLGGNNIRSFDVDDFVITPENKTWKYEDRDYRFVTGESALFDFGVEDPVTIRVSGVKDRNGNVTSPSSIVLNTPVPPYLNHQYPANNTEYIPTAAKISFDVHDAWAGVDKSTISVTISGVVYNSGTNSDKISIELIEGADVLGSGAGYHVVVAPIQRFSELQNVTVVARYRDLKGNTGSATWHFKTSPNCSELACCSVDILLGENGIQGYQNQQLVISGGNPTVDSLTGYGEYTGRIFVIDCNVDRYGLSVYSGHQNDANPHLVKSGILLDEIYLSGDNDVVKAELSGRTLILGLKINDISLVGDTPYSGEVLNTGNVNFTRHIAGNGDYSRVSGYLVQVYSGGQLYKTGKIMGVVNTGLFINNLPDGEYVWSVVAFDKLGNESESSEEIPFAVDTTAPDFTFANNSGYECETGYLNIMNVLDSHLDSLQYKFGTNDWGTITSYAVYSPITGIVIVTGYVKDANENIAQKTATYEFVNTGVTLVSPYVVGGVLSGTREIGNVITLLQATEGACGTENLTGQIVSCSLVNGTMDNGILSVTVNDGVEGTGRCEVKITDDDGSWATGKIVFRVDKKAPICEIIVPNGCFSGEVSLILSGSNDISKYKFDNGGSRINWTGNVESFVSQTGNYTLYVMDNVGNQASCTGNVDIDVLDQIKPTIVTLSGVSVPECSTGTANITAIDDGCGSEDLKYKWNGGSFGSVTQYSLYSGSAGSTGINVRVKDSVGNITGSSVTFTWTNSGITADDIMVDGIGNNSTGVNWKTESHASDGLCGSETVYFSGFINDGINGTCSTDSGDIIIFVPESDFEGTGSCIIELVDDEGSTGQVVITFVGIDTKKPECLISYDDTCTKEGISLSMITTGASYYSWTGFGNMVGENIAKVVSVNGNVTGYVEDAAGNTGICTGYIDNYDNILPIVTGANKSGAECTVIQGSIQASDEGCGNGNLVYNWTGYGDGYGLNYSGYSAVVTGKTATVTVTDGALNSQTANVNYTWTDTKPTLGSGTLTYNLSVTGTNVLYNDLIVSMGAIDGACGSATISNTGSISCTAGSASWIETGIQVTPPENGTGSVTCTVWFVDDEGSTVSGKVIYTYDTKKPGVELTGTNLACMKVSSFSVTGTFTESVNGFVSTDVTVTNGNVDNFGGNAEVYTWIVNMNPMVPVKVIVPAGVAYDDAGNTNTISNELTGMYDNVGPKAVSLMQPGDTVYADFTTLGWTSTTDSGCAGVSGYNWEIYGGNCISGTLMDNGFEGSGNLTANVSGLVDRGNYCRRVQPVDNFGNTGEWTEGEFKVDLSNIGCKITPVDSACTSGEVEVKLEAAGDYTIGTVYLSWIGTGDHTNTNPLYTGLTYSGQTVTGYIYQTVTNKWNVCEYVADGIIDQIQPTIVTLSGDEVPECTTGTANITATDEGCGDTSLTYKWNGNNNFGGDTSYSLWSGKIGERIVSVQVKDAVGNITGSNVTFKWTNTPITANDFTGSDNVGNSPKTTNWRINSNAVDGACGSGSQNVRWVRVLLTGEKGDCTRSGDEITYTPKPNMEGDDMCVILLADDEGSGKKVSIYWGGIDTVAPTCKVSVASGCFSGGVELTVTSNETINTIVGGGIEWNNLGSSATGTVYSNGAVVATITDVNNNVGVCTGDVTNISTGVLSTPSGLTPLSGTQTNITTQTFTWSNVGNNGCRELSGYEYQRCVGAVCTDESTIISVPSNEQIEGGLEDGVHYWRVRTVDNMGGKSAWSGAILIINTNKPQCTISYSPQSCTSGNVTLTITGNAGLHYSWTGIGQLGSLTKVVSNNGTYLGYVRDDAGNTGDCTTEISNISTGVLPAPDGLTPFSGTTTNDNTPTLSWNEVTTEGTCREVAGYNYMICSDSTCSDVVDSGYSNNTSWTTVVLSDGKYYWRVQTVDDLGGKSEWAESVLIVDTVAPVCTIEIPEGCYSGNVQIILSGNSNDIVIYSRWNMSTGSFDGNETTGVNNTGTYVGYVWDTVGNTGVCTGIVTNVILDQSEISYEITNAQGAECTTITGRVEVDTGDGCGNENMDSFVYNWVGGSSTKYNGVYSGRAGDMTIDLTIINHAGISVTTGVTYTWTDSAVTLDSGIQDIGTISGNYVITTGGLIDLFGAIEGACGKINVTVTGVDCSGASMSITNGTVTITPNTNLDKQDGYCEFRFGDDEGLQTVVGKLEFIADNVMPEIELEGDIACVKGGTTKIITGTWSEEILGFDTGDVSVTNGTIGNDWLINNNPIYLWSVSSPTLGIGTTTVVVFEGVARDSAGNTNTQSNQISREYDNVGPSDVMFTNWQNTIFTTETTLNWDVATDSGCAGVSGYNYKFVEGVNCNGNIINGFKINTSLDVNNLEHGNSYTLCVQAVDNFGNTGNWTGKTFEVDLDSIGCVFEESDCSNTSVTLTLKPGEGVDGGDIFLSWTGYENMENTSQLTRQFTQYGVIVTGYIEQRSGNVKKQKMCTGIITHIDDIHPTIMSVTPGEGYECEMITGSIEMTDDGCGDTPSLFQYQWNGLGLTGNNEYGINNNSGNVSRIIYVIGYDGANNTVSTGVQFTWNNSAISGHNFTGSDNVGNSAKTVNWKVLSEVVDGACGSGTVYFSGMLSSGSYGTCSVDGDNITYIPTVQFDGNDSCTIQVIDDENTTKNIVVYWGGIDTEIPTCTLDVQAGQQCTSGDVTLVINAQNVSSYSFDGENFGNNNSKIVSDFEVYTGYVKDSAGNIGVCTGTANTGVLDQNNPILTVTNKSGLECSTITITVEGSDNSCGMSGLIYNWSGFNNVTDTNSIYRATTGSQSVSVSVTDGVGHITMKSVTYTWIDDPVRGSDFTVNNVGNGIIVDWFISGSVSAGACELSGITASTSSTGCTISGNNLTYTPTDGKTGADECTLTIRDDDGSVDIVVTFEGIDNEKPTVDLIGEDLECTTTTGVVVTGIFSEEVLGVVTGSLVGQNVNILDFEKVDDVTYVWTLELVEGGTGKVWISKDGIKDESENELENNSNEVELGSLDETGPEKVDLSSPGNNTTGYTNQVTWSWNPSNVSGCAGIDHYVLKICENSAMTDSCDLFTGNGTTKSETRNNGTYYWNVVAVDTNGNESEVSETWKYTIESIAPQCHIESLSECTSGGVELKLVSSRTGTIIASGGIVWSPNAAGIEWMGTISENLVISGIIIMDTDGHTGQCEDFTVSIFDNTIPTLTAENVEIEECTTGGFVVIARDDGCASGDIKYRFGSVYGSSSWGNTGKIIIPWTGLITKGGMNVAQLYRAKDGNDNKTDINTGIIHFVDAEVTLRQNETGIDLGKLTGDYVGETGVKDIFEPREGDNCKDDYIIQSVGSCYLSGQMESGITLTLGNDSYTLGVSDFIENNTEKYGTGYCEVIFADNEGNTATGNIYFEIDTRKCFDEEWDNDYFLTPEFWGLEPNDNQVVCALYGSGGSDQTAYTLGWNDYEADSTCSGFDEMEVVWTGELPATLQENTVYVLTSTGFTRNSIILPRCTAIVSNQTKGKDTTIKNVSITMNNKYGILDNLSLAGNGGIGVQMNTDSDTLNVVKVYKYDTGVVLNGAENNILNNLQVYANGEGIRLNNSTHNAVNNSQIYYNDTIGMNFVGSDGNILGNSEIYGHSTGLRFADGSDNNVVKNIIYYNNHENNSRPIMEVASGLVNYYEGENIFIRDTFTGDESSACENAGYSVATGTNTGYAIYKHSDPLTEYWYTSTISTGGCIMSGEEVLICDSSMSNCRAPQGNETHTCNTSWQWTYCNTTWTEHSRDLLTKRGDGSIVTEITANRIGWVPGIIDESYYAGYAVDYQTNPRSNGGYLFDWSGYTSNVSNNGFTNNVDGYSYGVNVKTQEDTQVYQGSSLIDGGKVEESYYIGSNVERIEGNIEYHMDTKTHYYLTGTLGTTAIKNGIIVNKYTWLGNIPQNVSSAIDLNTQNRRDRTYIDSFVNRGIDEELQLNTEGVEWRFDDRTYNEYGFVMQMYGEEYFATHMYRNIDVPQPYLDIEPKEFCQNLNATSGSMAMTGIWLAYEAYMTGFNTGEIHVEGGVTGITDFVDKSDSWTQDGRIENYLYTWIAHLAPNQTGRVYVPANITQDALDILNLGTSQSYYWDAAGPEVGLAAPVQVVNGEFQINECEGDTLRINVSDYCAGPKELKYSGHFWDSEDSWVAYYFIENIKANVGRTGNITRPQEVWARDNYDNESYTLMTGTILDVEPTIDNYNTRAKAKDFGVVSGDVMIADVITLLGANEGNCLTGDLVVMGVSCDEGATGTKIAGDKPIGIEIEIGEGIEDDIICTVVIEDNEHLVPVTGYIKFTVDTKEPECNVSYNNQCTEGGVELSIVSEGNVVYSWDNSSYSNTFTTTVNINGTYTGYVKDEVGNIGSCSTGVDNIDTGSMTAPRLRKPIDGKVFTGTRDVTLIWSGSTISGCAEVQGYRLEISTGNGNTFNENIKWIHETSTAQYTQNSIPNGTYYWKVYAIDTLGHEVVSEDEWMFEMNSTGLSCNIIPENLNGEVCTSGDIRLVLNVNRDPFMIQNSGNVDNWEWSGTLNTYVAVVSGSIGSVEGVVVKAGEETAPCNLGTLNNVDVVPPQLVGSGLISELTECTAGNIMINANDIGCADDLGSLEYWFGSKFGTGQWQTSNTLSLTAEQVGRTGGVAYPVSQQIKVRDALMNITTKTLDVLIADIPPYVTGADLGTLTGTRVVNVNTSEGVCGTGDLEVINVVCTTGVEGTTSGLILTIVPGNNFEGTGYCDVTVQDNEGSSAVGRYTFGIDTTLPTCHMYVEGVEGGQCMKGSGTLKLEAVETEGIAGYSWDNTDWSVNSLEKTITESGTYVGYIKDTAGNVATCSLNITGVDNKEPNMEFDNTYWTGYECNTGSITVTGEDEGCGMNGLRYNWVGQNYTGQTLRLYRGTTGQEEIYVEVIDGVGNKTGRNVTYEWIDDPVVGHDFVVGEVGNGKTVNWKEEAGAHAGVCEEISASVKEDGTKGECTISGNNLTYTPTDGKTGADECTLTIRDDDGSVDVVVTFSGIDGEKPTCHMYVEGVEGGQCMKGSGTLKLEAVETEGIAGYSWDNTDWSVNSLEKTITESGTYVGYIKDTAGNVATCSLNITGVDNKEPNMEFDNTYWTGYECNTGSITVTGEDEGCGMNGLRYNWVGQNYTGQTLRLYRGTTGQEEIYVEVIDGVGNKTGRNVTYEWIDDPVVGHDFVVGEVGNGKTVNWKEEAGAHAGVCEEISASVKEDGTKGECTISGNNLTYTPTDGKTGADECTLTIRDDDGSVDVVVTFSGIDGEKPTCHMYVEGVEGGQCMKGSGTLKLEAVETEGIAGYSWDNTDWSVNSLEKTITESGTYVGYIKDTAGNVATCSLNITGVDNKEPNMEFDNTYWTGYECNTGSITVTGEDEGCGMNGLRYNWVGQNYTGQMLRLYRGTTGQEEIYVEVIDGVGNKTGRNVTYEWIDDPVVGHDFMVGNVKSGITVNWKEKAEAYAGGCEIITATVVGGAKGMCEIDGDKLTYTRGGVETGEDECTLTIRDDDGSVDVQATFAGLGDDDPRILELTGGLGGDGQCTNEDVFEVTGIFTEDVVGVSITSLTGLNVEITNFEKISGIEYTWTVRLLGGTGVVWLTGNIHDEDDNQLVFGDNRLILAVLDNEPIEFTIQEATGYECEMITGNVYVDTGDTCGKDSLDKFIYSWNNGEFGIIASFATDSIGVTGYYVPLSIKDGAGNIVNTGVKYTWYDSPVVLNNGTSQNLGIVFDSISPYTTGSSALIDLFGAVEGACGKTNIIVSGGVCEGATILVEAGLVTISPLDHVNGAGRCELVFSDDDENTVTGVVYFDVVTQKPECNISYDNTCTNKNIKLVMNVTGASQYSWDNSDFEEVSGNIIEVVNTGGRYSCFVKDNYGNEGSGTIEVTTYDITGPTKPLLRNLVGRTVVETHVDIDWDPSVVDGCAELSGYIIKVCERDTTSCQTGVISASTTGWTAISLKNNTVYDVLLWSEDTLHNPSPIDTGWFYVDTNGIHCYISPDRNFCGTGPVKLILTGDGDMLAWSSLDNLENINRLELTVNNLNKLSFVGYVKDSATGRTGSCVFDTIRDVLDQNAPTIQTSQFVGEQCSIITGDIRANDVGCAGNSGFVYKFPDLDWSTNNKYVLSQNNVGEKIISVGIKDRLGNYMSGSVKYIWTDTKPTASSFTMSLLAGNTANWKTSSNANEGACKAERLTATVKENGHRGTCTISGGLLVYEVSDLVKGVTDKCTLTIKDEEDNTVDVVVTITDINKMPTIRLLSPANGSLFAYGSAVDLVWTVDDTGYVDISGFDYKVSSVDTGVDKVVTGFTTNTWVSGLVLPPAHYDWNVTVVLAGEYNNVISATWKFNGIGGQPDNCPNGDKSPSIYDGVCTGHSAAECKADDYSDELQEAYRYAYLKGVTTKDNICEADPDGYLYRDHFAKMISVYAMAVAGRTPKYGKYGCDQFDDIADDSIELQNYMKLSCELELMGMNSDGVTPKTYFDPHSIVTRAEFGTVFSRLIFGDKYNVKNESEVYKQEGFWYKKHLQALKTYGVMTMIDGDWPKYLERRGRVMLMMLRADKYGLFKGELPSQNGVTALFTQ